MVKQLTIWRVAAAFIAAPVAPAAAFAFAMPMYGSLPDLSERIWWTFLPVLLVGGYPPTLIFGVPAFLVLRRKLQPTFLTCSLVGALVASPWAIMFLLAAARDPNFWDSIERNGLLEATTEITIVPALGLLGGAVFWLVAAAGPSRAKPTDIIPPAA
jgi:hypothetical protein